MYTENGIKARAFLYIKAASIAKRARDENMFGKYIYCVHQHHHHHHTYERPLILYEQMRTEFDTIILHFRNVFI